MLYFDHNASHPLSPTARKAWLDATERFPGNPSSPHRLGQRAEKALDDARSKLAQILGVSPDRVMFTSGATEANNAVIARFDHVWHSAVEHPCVVEPSVGKSSLMPVDAHGVADLGWLEDRLKKEKPGLVALMAANNETGTLQPWQKAAALCHEHAIPFLCDAAQWVGKLPATGLGDATFVSGCAHKFGGPLGVGFLVCPGDFKSQLRGGPQEDGRRAGTENLPAILSMVAALEERVTQIAGIPERLAWRRYFEEMLKASIEGISILGDGTERLWNTVSVLMPELDDCRRRWVVVMDRLSFAVSTGSACSSGKEKPSHVLTAMGISPSDAGRALRFSAGWETTELDWQNLLEGVRAAVAEMQK